MKILQADDHELFREGMRYILSDLADDLTIVQSQDYDSTVAQIDTHPDMDLVLLDLNMPGMCGVDGLRRLVTRFPTAPVVVVSASCMHCDIEAALEMGAAGYVPKSSPSGVLLAALQLVLAGGVYVPRPHAAPSLAERSDQSPVADLTSRQREILTYIAEGMPNKAIAQQLYLSESTVKGHVRAVMQILEVSNRVQAINKARELGQLSQLSV